MEHAWYVYIVRCRDNSFYTGISADVLNRVSRHNSGKGSKYTKIRRPVELVYTEGFDRKDEARRREIEIKDLSADNKVKLIQTGPGRRFPSALVIK